MLASHKKNEHEFVHNLNFQEGLHSRNPGLTDGALREATVHHLQSGSPSRTNTYLLSILQLSVTPGTVAHQAPLPMEFSRQEYWSGLPFLSPQGSNPRLLCVFLHY